MVKVNIFKDSGFQKTKKDLKRVVVMRCMDNLFELSFHVGIVLSPPFKVQYSNVSRQHLDPEKRGSVFQFEDFFTSSIFLSQDEFDDLDNSDIPLAIHAEFNSYLVFAQSYIAELCACSNSYEVTFEASQMMIANFIDGIEDLIEFGLLLTEDGELKIGNKSESLTINHKNPHFGDILKFLDKGKISYSDLHNIIY